MNKGLAKYRRTGILYRLCVIAAASLVAACQTGPEQPVAVPDPGPPPRPTPPLGAAHGMYIPPADPETGQRKTPNSDLDETETIWHFRSAFNVAAISCTQPQYTGIVNYYNSFLNNSDTRLASVNRQLDQRFRSRFPGVNGLRVRDTHSTQLYNYFSLPPTMGLLCEHMFSRAPQAMTLSDAELYPYAKQTLDELDEIFIQFWEDYEDYMRRLAEWEALYGRVGRVTVGGGALYSDTPVAPSRPEARSERTGASFDNVPDGYTPPTSQPALPPAPITQTPQQTDNSMPAGYEPSRPGTSGATAQPPASPAPGEADGGQSGSTTPPASDDVFGRPTGER